MAIAKMVFVGSSSLQAHCALFPDLRWAVTGTPIQNNLKDFYSLIKFIQLAPFDDYRVWKATVEQRGELGGREGWGGKCFPPPPPPPPQKKKKPVLPLIPCN